MNFEEFVNDWWQGYISEHNNDGYNLPEIFSQMGYNEADTLDEDETIEDFLGGLEANEVYEFFFGYGNKADKIDDIPSTTDFCTDMLVQAAKEAGYGNYSFTKDSVSDMAEHMDGYTNPESFFHDLSHGCSSGMIGMLIYNDDCKRIYIEHIDDMESFKEEFEEEIGDPIKNSERLPHYTFMCWLCYEELGWRIAGVLFPDKF